MKLSHRSRSLLRTSLEEPTVVRLTLGLICLASIAGAVGVLGERTTRASASLPPQAGETSLDDAWTKIDARSLPPTRRRQPVLPTSYGAVSLNPVALWKVLGRVPMEFSTAKSEPVILALPMPDGTFTRFRIEESPIMAPELAAKFREIKTYSGQGLDDRTAVTRFDLTPAGFHAVVLSVQGSVFIGPYDDGDTANYVSYNMQDLPKQAGSFRCLADEAKTFLPGGKANVTPAVVSGATLRTYRLAVGCTAEYTATYGGGTVPGGLAAVTTAVNNLNAFLEREVAIRLILVANETSVIFLNTATDGYTHDNINSMANENQANLDAIIGAANYDVGHFFDGETISGGFGASGLAFFGVCVNGVKAKGGVLFQSSPPDGPATLRAIAHEMGHQFTARHSYNASNAGCFQRDTASAYEPGSGSGIMSYTGNCDTENLPATSVYHTASLEQIITYSTTGTGNGCAGQIATGNHPPDIATGSTFTIPRSTPFKLTTVASDQDGDALTYSWEEFDLAPAAATAPPDNDVDGQPRPIFRAFDPVLSPSRTFPKLSDILINTSTFGEALPTITRTMTFKATVRDNRAGGGGVSSAATTVNVTAAAGPFAVTAPNTAVTWTGGATQAVTWNVNNTTAAPVSCANVKISLSTDGGNTFPIVLAASTANDGTENITVPNGVSTTQARIKVEAVGNIFFDIDDSIFTVTPSGTCPAISGINQSIGAVGTNVIITGANFTGATAVKFFTNVTAVFTVNSNTQITATVPASATTGPITISKTSCSDVQTSTFTVSGSASSDLSADDGLSNGCLGAGNPGTVVIYANRLTPSSYPATLTSVLINFPGGGCGLVAGTNVGIVVGNGTNGTNISNTVFQITPTTVQSPLSSYVAYPVPNFTIASGDFVVGFQITAASSVFPVSVDSTAPLNHRSYISFDGSNFDLVGNIFAGFDRNFLIRARVFSGAVNCPTIANISPTSGPPGTLVTITGTDLLGVGKLRFSSNVTASFNVIGDTQITTTVPSSGSITGPITLSKPGCSDAASSSFTVTGASAVTLIDFAATAHDKGVSIRWQTGFEVDNLGFNIYREQSGNRTRVNADLIAGSALMTGRAALTAGHSYQWLDRSPEVQQGASYYLEDIDTTGARTLHGPIRPRFAAGEPVPVTSSALLANLGSTTGASSEPRSIERTPKSSEQLIKQQQLASQAAVKISIREEGWYRISQPELVAAGLDAKADPRTMQLFLEGAERPILGSGESDGSFDKTGAIEFYATGQDTPWTDAHVYWLVAGKEAGKRINVAHSPARPGGAPSFLYTVERKDRSIYFASLRNGDAENFFGSVVASQPLEQTLTLASVDATADRQAEIEVALQGVTDLSGTNPDHQVKITLNGVEVGKLVFDGRGHQTEKFPASQGLLANGINSVTLTAEAGAADVSLVDYIRISYWRGYQADNDVLKCPVGGTQQDPRGTNIAQTIGGFTSPSIRVVDITDPESVVELQGDVVGSAGGYSVSVEAIGSRTLMAFTADRARHPAAISANVPSSLTQQKGRADMLIIGRRSFFDSLKELVSLRQRQGLKVALVDIEDIFDEFNFGEKSPRAVKDFLSFAQSNWKTPPRFVLLAGDANVDPRDYLGLGDADLVPTKLLDTDFMETASDDWFADFDDDGLADIAIGRLPFRTQAEAAAIAAKITGYDSASPAKSALLVSDQNEGYDFEAASAQLRGLMPPALKIQQLDRGSVDVGAARSQLLEALNKGQKIVNYIGHGSMNVWRANLLTTTDARSLSNGRHLSFFAMMTCLNGYYTDPSLDSLAESLMKSERGGAVAVWASSGMTLPGAQSAIDLELYRLLFNAAGKRLTLGEATVRAKASVADLDVRRTWILFGDPATVLR